VPVDIKRHRFLNFVHENNGAAAICCRRLLGDGDGAQIRAETVIVGSLSVRSNTFDLDQYGFLVYYARDEGRTSQEQSHRGSEG